MKKKVLCIMLSALLGVGTLAGCGNAESENTEGASTVSTESNGSTDSGSTENVYLKDLEVDQYVTLGTYKGLEVTVAPVAVADEDVTALMNNAYSSTITAESGGIVDRAVEVGDTINLDYEGKQDGVAFSGGTAAGATLTIGSGSFIEGFEDGLVGVMPGETVDLDLTFPENYGNTELAGQAVVFTVTVNFIIPANPVMEDAVIAAMGLEGVTNVEEFEQFVYDYLYANNQSQYDDNVQNAVLEALVETSTYGELPEALLAEYEQNTRASIEAEASSYGMDAETLVMMAYGMSYDEFIDFYCPQVVKQMLAMQAIANQEDMNMSDEELEEILQSYADQSGSESVDAFLGGTDREDYREYLMYNNVLAFLVENAVVTNA